METLEEKIRRVVAEDVKLSPYDPAWPQIFEAEKRHLLACLTGKLLLRIEHFGSTAVPGLPAKPIVDILVEVASLEETRKTIAPLLESQGYDYFWRPIGSENIPPFYAWFIKRNEKGERTHHIHMVEKNFEHWDRLLFRDYLREFPESARAYGELKMQLSNEFPNDRIAYTKAKSSFIVELTQKAKIHYGKAKE
ncbi:MAG: hypothetical protein A2X49_05895 [Lentisphaerae bacterium GWF2_52_8]|nr:MAG: hypothetical protein A2X49_05895 [Lentisphaerae bacterium GWF2_52_8]